MSSRPARLPLLAVCATLLGVAPAADAVTPAGPVSRAASGPVCDAGGCPAARSQAARLSARSIVEKLCKDSHCAPKRRGAR